MEKIKAGIIGATGYAGVELVKILQNHPDVKLGKISSVSFEGKKISDVYPNLLGICDDDLTNEEDVINDCDVIFAALPHGLSEPIAKKCVEQDKLFIDLGADFRLEDEEVYKKWYGLEYKEKDLHKQSYYCIPELHREQMKNIKIIANPGCYTTSVPLALAPIIIAEKGDLNSIIIDAKSGVTGAGRGLSQNTHFAELNEGFASYKTAGHRHNPEIEQTLSALAKEKVNVTFVPHLLPINRGILATCYIKVNGLTYDELHDLYVNFYKGEKFIRVLAKGKAADLKYVKYSNYCDISVHFDEHTSTAIIISVIDNMVKGAAGQAVQNMNIALGLQEDAGLGMIPPAF